MQVINKLWISISIVMVGPLVLIIARGYLLDSRRIFPWYISMPTAFVLLAIMITNIIAGTYLIASMADRIAPLKKWTLDSANTSNLGIACFFIAIILLAVIESFYQLFL